MSSVPLCPHCVEPGETPLVCERCGWRWHANPKPTAAALVEWRPGEETEPRVLLLRRAVEPGHGAWDLPAGYLDPGESPEEAAVRETREEAGLAIELVRLIGVYTSRSGNAVSTVYVARPRDRQPVVRIDAESSDHRWVGRSDVPEWLPRMAFPSMAAALGDWAADRSGVPRAW